MTFGTGYAGFAPLGLGTPTGYPAPGEAYVRSADLVPARALDLPAKDYAVDDDATAVPHAAWDALAQNVVLRLTTRRGRLAFDRRFGNAFLALDRVPADLQGFAVRAVAEALGDLLAAGDVEIVEVTADTSLGLAVLRVTWRDVRTGREATTSAVADGSP